MSNQIFTAIRILTLCITASAIVSCEYEFIEPEKVILPEVISFADDILPIFDQSCNISGCHVSGFGALDLSAENAYADLFRQGLINVEVPEESGLYTKLIDNSGTHQGRSTASEQAIVLEWINKGAQNN
ncbi:MAG: hypothetical protein HKN87_21345 [Saprospiraceae bacterium]|nr:hypothetical protein [Saprospiraceae bacterium]